MKILIIGIILSMSCLSFDSSQQETTHDLKKIGSEILNGRKIVTIDTSLIYQLIDSVLAKDSNSREFYFKVFNKINEPAKGEIAVEMDWKIKEFCFQYPNEFFNISNYEINDYAQRIGELFRTEEEYPIESAQNYIDNIKKRTDSVYCDKVNAFSIELIKKAKGEK
jgi:hypothetical protein